MVLINTYHRNMFELDQSQSKRIRGGHAKHL